MVLSSTNISESERKAMIKWWGSWMSILMFAIT